MYDTTIGWRFVNPLMKSRYGVDTMPETAEKVAEEFHVIARGSGCVRLSQPAAVRRARMRPASSTQEIVPVMIPQNEGRSPDRVATDEHPRADTSLEVLAKLTADGEADGYRHGRQRFGRQ